MAIAATTSYSVIRQMRNQVWYQASAITLPTSTDEQDRCGLIVLLKN
jgi:hypothetical protein